MEWKPSSGVDQEKARKLQQGITKKPEWMTKVSGLFDKKEETNPQMEALKRRSERPTSGG